MSRFKIYIFGLFFTFSVAHCNEDSDSNVINLPKLFHLDDFEHCLERTDGIYCLGQFEVYSDVQPNPLFDLIQEKSQNINIYNRSYLHRGYCLPMRCPGSEANATARFERCLDDWARGHSLRARIHTLHYCRAHGEPRPGAPDTNDTPHRVVLYSVCILLLMAVVGTVYDIYFARKGSQNPILMSFSIRINWKKLISKYQEVDSCLRPLQVINGYRFTSGVGFVCCHAFILTAATYQHNPSVIEKVLFSPTGFVLGASMTFTSIYLIISSFLTTYSILLVGAREKSIVKQFIQMVLKRIIRIYPVYILLNGFAATWYKSFGDGPMWPVLVAGESDICRRKFWATAAFLQNFIDKRNLCLVQTWIIAVDFQLHLPILLLTLILVKRRQHAIKVLSVLLVAAIALLAHQAFEKDLIPTYMYMTPEVFRNFFKGGESFFDLYIHPINGSIAVIVGCMVAFILADHQERDINYSNSKVFIILHWLSVPAIFFWWGSSYVYFRHYDRTAQHAMIVVERVFTAFVSAFHMYSIIKIKGIQHKIMSLCPMMRVMMKLGLSVSMSHWCINVLILTNRWTLHDTSALQLATDIINVYVLANFVAVPLTLLVEYPLQMLGNRLINQIRWFSPSKAKTK